MAISKNVINEGAQYFLKVMSLHGDISSDGMEHDPYSFGKVASRTPQQVGADSPDFIPPR